MIIRRESAEIPLFHIVGAGRRLHYAPGHLAMRPSAKLREHAIRARREWEQKRRAPFAPECLTVNLTDKCNLACSYCYTQAGRGPAVVSLRAVEAAGRLVAANCVAKAKTFHLVLHGGGEPTLEWKLLEEVTARGLLQQRGALPMQVLSIGELEGLEEDLHGGESLQRLLAEKVGAVRWRDESVRNYCYASRPDLVQKKCRYLLQRFNELSEAAIAYFRLHKSSEVM